MTTVFEVPAEPLIEKTAMKLKDVKSIKAPEWSTFVKTGQHKERPPENKDWWYIRVAAVLRKVYLHSPIGVTQLRSMFGGKADKGSKPHKAVLASGAVIRNSLQQLESAGLITSEKGKGRIITGKGQSLLDNTAHEVLTELVGDNPELGKY
jgi:small subunit ribosomal protein S19e